MNHEQKKQAILELARTLPAASIRALVDVELEDLIDETCSAEGHAFDNDHCGREEHRFCRICYEPQYSKEERDAIISARQAKVVEAEGCKPSLSGGSPEPRSIFNRIGVWLGK
jgi:hypothetical protein